LERHSFAECTGLDRGLDRKRIDSKNPYQAGDEYIQWLKAAAAIHTQS
jgi:hypothetical protein